MMNLIVNNEIILYRYNYKYEIRSKINANNNYFEIDNV